MSKILCGWVPPREEDVLGRSSCDSFLGIGCILAEGHLCEDHLLRSKLGRHFLYAPQFWCDNIECECANSSDAWDVCGTYEEITEGEAKEVKDKQSK